MNEVTVTMSHKKDTKRTVVYEAEEASSGPAPITTLYIQKWAVSKPPPEFIAVSVKEVE